jgi:hypothetical protein
MPLRTGAQLAREIIATTVQRSPSTKSAANASSASLARPRFHPSAFATAGISAGEVARKRRKIWDEREPERVGPTCANALARCPAPRP